MKTKANKTIIFTRKTCLYDKHVYMINMFLLFKSIICLEQEKHVILYIKKLKNKYKNAKRQ